MTEIAQNFERVEMRVFSEGSGLVVEFLDATYVRAETILCCLDDYSLHAVMCDGQFYMGMVPDELRQDLTKYKSICLRGALPSGELIEMQSYLSFYKENEVMRNNVKNHESIYSADEGEEIPYELLPVCSSGSHAMTSVIIAS